MQPSQVTAASAEVVTEVLGDPSAFLTAAAEAAPGWSERYGGPEGVAQLTSVLHEQLARHTKLNAELRRSTLIFLRGQPGVSLATLAGLLGVSRPAVQTASKPRGGTGQSAGPFSRLERAGGWRS